MSPSSGPSLLFADLYELTMGAAYHAANLDQTACFSLFVRKKENSRAYFVCAGINEAVQAVAKLNFSDKDLAYLKGLNMFSGSFLNYLKNFRFTGHIRAMAEGALFFPDEPVMEVTAPVIEAQVLETFLLNSVGFQTMIASKAARCVHAAAGRALVDFSFRRTHGGEAGIKVARASYLAGFAGTSNLLAGKKYNIPVSGTMAHSYVGAFESETDAFVHFARCFPENAVFLIDTYDTPGGAGHAVEAARILEKEGIAVQGVRLDSGDMAGLSREVRKILDDGGLAHVKIFASSNLDEFELTDLIQKGAKIDAFGVGTRLGVSSDAPYLDIVYKMVEIGGRQVRKKSTGKKTLAGSKQVFRITGLDGTYLRDIIGTKDEQIPGAGKLLAPVMEKGRPLVDFAPLEKIRENFSQNFKNLDPACKNLDRPAPFEVKISPALSALQKQAG